MIAPLRLEGCAPVGGKAVDQPRRSKGIDADRVLLLESERSVGRRLKIKHVIDERIRSDPADMRRESAFNDRLGRRRRRDGRRGIREGPSGRGVPHVLNGRIVVGRDAVNEVERAGGRSLGKADIGIVPCPRMPERIREAAGRGRVVGDLRKCPDAVCDGAAPEAADRRYNHVVVAFERIRRRRQRRLRMRKADDGHHRDRRHIILVVVAVARIACLRIAAHFVGGGLGIIRTRKSWKWRRAVRSATGRIAKQLEPAAVRSKRGEIGMARTARLPGLPCEAWQRLCRRRETNGQQTSKPEDHRSRGNQRATPGVEREPSTIYRARVRSRVTIVRAHRSLPCLKGGQLIDNNIESGN